MSRNVRNAAVAFAQQVLGALAGGVGIFFVAREMPDAKTQIGIIGTALSIVGLFIAIQRAFDGSHVKRISEGQDLARCNSTYLILKVASTTAMVLVVLLGLDVWTGVLRRGFQSPVLVRVVELMLVYQVLNALGEYSRRTLEGRGNIFLGQVILASEHVVKGVATVYVAFYGLEPLYPDSRDAFGLGIAYVAGAAALAVVALLIGLGQPLGRPSWTLAKRYTSFAIPAAITASMFLVATNVTTVSVNLFWSLDDAGIFTAPNRYVQFLPAIATAAGTALFPVFSALHAQGRTAPDVMQSVLRWISLALLPIIAVTVVLREAIVHVFLKDSFLSTDWTRSSASVLAILAVAAYVGSMRMTLSANLAAVNRQREVTKAAIVSMLGTVVLSVVFVAPSLFGVEFLGWRAAGAALAVLVASFLGLGTTLRAARVHAGVRLPRLHRHAVMFLAACAVLALFTLAVAPTSFRIYHLIAASGLATVAFVGTGFAVRELTRADVALLQAALHPREWRAYLASERRAPPR